MLHAIREVPSRAPEIEIGAPEIGGPQAGLTRRPSAVRLRALFLRRFREVGQVRAAAALAGVARSTLYRWREKDAQFRARWETYDEMRRHDAEEHLERLMREGEKTTAFYKGQAVGWKVSFTARPAIGLLASQDRRDRLRQREREWEAKRASVSHSGARLSGKSPEGSKACADETPRKTEAAVTPAPEPARVPLAPHRVSAEKSAYVSHFGGRFRTENQVTSTGWPGTSSRKTPPVPPARSLLHNDWSLPKAARLPSPALNLGR